MAKDIQETKIGYNLVAEAYHNLRVFGQKFHNEFLEMPTTLKLLGNVKGKKILDWGCGTGIYAKILSKKGAKVNGIDISEKEIEIAKRENPSVEFKVANAQKLPYKNSEFDIVLAALALSYTKDWNSLLKEINRVLKPKGIFVFSEGNPVTDCIRLKGNKKIEISRGYFDEKTKIRTPWWNNVVMPWYHKTFGTIVKLLKKNGFKLDDFEDAKPIKKAKSIFPKDYAKTNLLPYFCTWKWIKVR
jgi:ubiquinone/menaquinone biosynthesis C-methylase UbiE